MGALHTSVLSVIIYTPEKAGQKNRRGGGDWRGGLRSTHTKRGTLTPTVRVVDCACWSGAA